MQVYLNDIISAVVFFPFVALLITAPYMVYQYRKYGSIPWWRTFMVFLVAFYLLCAYFQAILPLPADRTAVVAYAAQPQLVPFTSIRTLLASSGFVGSDPGTWAVIFTDLNFYEIVFNVLLMVPLGMFLRYYFRWSWWKCTLAGFAFSLFIEVSQLTGLFGLYEHPYRLFDVDDLIVNTLGALVGFWVVGPVIKWLPDMKTVNRKARTKGMRVSLTRRTFAFLIDMALVSVSVTIFALVAALLGLGSIDTEIDLAGISLFSVDRILFLVVFFLLIPILTKGQTLGQKLLKLKIARPDGTKAAWYQYLVRYGVLFVLLSAPIWLFDWLESAQFTAGTEISWFEGVGRNLQPFLPLISLGLWSIWIISVLVRNQAAHHRGSLFTMLNEHLSGTRVMTVDGAKMLRERAIVLDVEEVGKLEHLIAEEEVPLEELMRRAGHSVVEVIGEHSPQPTNVLVICGSGNNGGDGWVVAQELAEKGYEVSLVTPKLPGLLGAEPARSVAISVFSNVQEKDLPLRVVVAPADEIFFQELEKAEIVVDAILGTGFTGDKVSEPYATWIGATNRYRKKNENVFLVSIDVPSGLSAQTGKHAATCIAADTTVTMIVYKPGLLAENSHRFCGTIRLAHLVDITPYLARIRHQQNSR